jgi:TRAP-type C4-dicarboxylate transport system permease large subunit
VTRATPPWLIPLLVALLLITFFEPLCMWLPEIVYAR